MVLVGNLALINIGCDERGLETTPRRGELLLPVSGSPNCYSLLDEGTGLSPKSSQFSR